MPRHRHREFLGFLRTIDLRLKIGAFTPSRGVSFSCAVSAEKENKLSIISAGVVAANPSQKGTSIYSDFKCRGERRSCKVRFF